MRKVVGLSLIFIVFYVPALISHLNVTEILLHFSENTVLFTVCYIHRGVISKDNYIGTKYHSGNRASYNSSIVGYISLAMEMFLPSHCYTMNYVINVEMCTVKIF
jgi:hypothetical protein